ncbi:MAG: hypothetical protein ACOYOJ_21905 [Alsobacter sp.]
MALRQSQLKAAGHRWPTKGGKWHARSQATIERVNKLAQEIITLRRHGVGFGRRLTSLRHRQSGLTRMSLEALRRRIAAVSDILCTLNLVVWDSRTMMPSGGTETRGLQIATLTRLARVQLAADETLDLLGEAEREVAAVPPDDLAHEELRQVRRAVEVHRRVPAELVERRAAVRARGCGATIWMRGRIASPGDVPNRSGCCLR